MNICPAKKSDMKAVSDVVKKTIEALSLDELQKNAWKESNSEIVWLDKYQKYSIFIAVKNDVILGVLAFDGEEIQALFVDPDFQGQGIGSQLLNTIREYAYVKVYASLFAKEFYIKKGFTEIEKTTVTIKGIAIPALLLERKS
ncbi:MAG: GNAT family N-acetyltransferase [Candidatus Woesearchaeota archaeon]